MEHTQEDEEVKAGGKLTGRQEAMDSCCLCREVGGHGGVIATLFTFYTRCQPWGAWRRHLVPTFSLHPPTGDSLSGLPFTT